MTKPNENPEHVLVLMAHPDDPEFAAGGLLAQWSRAGSQITYVIVTDGSTGSDDPEMTGPKLAAIRETEQRAAAGVLGVNEIIFLGYPDGGVFNTQALRRDLVRQIRKYRPDLVITHDPTARLIGDTRINHPDHLAVGDTALNAVFPLARDRLSFPELLEEGLEPHKVMTVYLGMTDQPNFIADISATFEIKISALKEHKTQIGDPAQLKGRLTAYSQEIAADHPFTLGEPYRRIFLNR
jgi:LmbE family N-acetylglucosaminyl deacetylase